MMAAPGTPSQIQARTLGAFTVLHQLRSDWGGDLILACGLGPNGTALALASNIAGAVCLNLEEDAAVAREALRSGACDFVVNTLDEALRAIKNEVRRHRPLSVGLQGNPTTLLQEIFERGVLPHLFTSPGHTEAAAIFQSQGTVILGLAEITKPDGMPPQSGWQLQTFTFDSISERSAFDAKALALLPPEDALRSRWLQSASRILPRESPPQRVLWLTPEEVAQLRNDAPSESAD